MVIFQKMDDWEEKKKEEEEEEEEEKNDLLTCVASPQVKSIGNRGIGCEGVIGDVTLI